MSWRWYAVALLTAPLLTVAAGVALSLRSPELLPVIAITGDPFAVLVLALASGLLIAICEELGWTGFAIPQLRRRYGIIATGLTLGLMWGAWHFVLFWEAESFSAGDAGAVARAPLRLAARIPPVDGVGVRPNREPARRGPDARESRCHTN